jgi:hypothetical protein
MKYSRGIAALGLVCLAACSAPRHSVDAVRDRAETSTDVLADAPLQQLPGSPFVGDAKAAWYTDFHQIARYDVGTNAWQTFASPIPVARIERVGMSSDGAGGLLGVALACPERCAADGEDLVVVPFRRRGDKLEPLAATATVPSDSYVVPVTAATSSALFRVASASQTTTVLVDAGGTVDVASSDVSIPVLCQVDATTLLAVVDDPTAGADLARSEIRSGPSVDHLTRRSIPTDVAAALQAQGSSRICTDDGLAIVGTSSAHELRGTTWTEVPANVPGFGGRQLALGATIRTPDGALVIAGSQVDLTRSASGEWTGDASPSRPTQFAVVGHRLIAYPARSTPPEADAGQPEEEPSQGSLIDKRTTPTP